MFWGCELQCRTNLPKSYSILVWSDWPLKFFSSSSISRALATTGTTHIHLFVALAVSLAVWKYAGWIRSEIFKVFFFYFIDWTSESWEKRGNRVMMAMLIDHHARINSPKKRFPQIKKIFIGLTKHHNLFDGHQSLHIYQANDFITIPSPPLNFGNPPLIFGKVRKAAKNGQFWRLRNWI